MDRRNAHVEFGLNGERAVADIIRGRGHSVRHDGGNHYHDLVVNGSTTVEVKTAYPTGAAGNRHDRWQFNLTKNDGHHTPMEEDVLVLRCEVVDESECHHFVIPGSVLPSTLTKIDITQHPGTYRGKYHLFLEAWELLDCIVALRDKDGRQVALFEEEEMPF